MAPQMAFLLLLIALNTHLFLIHKGPARWASLGASAMCAAIAIAALISSYRSGCLGAPSVVEFRHGMTLCPGQSTRMTITLPALAPDRGI